MNKTRGYDLVSEQHVSIWRFVVTDSQLKNQDGSVKAKVYAIADIADIADAEPNEEWDLIIHKDMVAFKVPTERTTYIYTKKYWESRCSQNLNNIKILKK